ncbi:MAG: hypothetical protein JSR93_09555 [Verrucomicrobia bacterium]|nr:hypothetical protein [Verrucomicrobiota bacterium]
MAVSAVERNFNYLRASAFIFNQEKIEEGKRVFALVCREPHNDEWGVYHFLWIVKGSPAGIRDYGRICFHDIHGISSSGREKALAIHRHLTARGTFTEFVLTPSIERFYVRCGILQLPAQIIETVAQEETDCDLIKNLAGAAAFGVGILVTAGGVLMMLREGGAPRELPTLAGHVTVGGGHFQFGEAVQRIAEMIPQIRASTSDALTSSRVIPLEARCVPQASDHVSLVVDDGWVMQNSTPQYTHRGTWHREDPSSRWEGSLEQERFEQGLNNLQRRMEDLIAEVAPSRLQEVRQQIQELRERLSTIQVQSGEKLWEIVKDSFFILLPKSNVEWDVLKNFSEIYQGFKEFGDIGYTAKEVRAELGRLLELERSLERANELQRLQDLRG